MPTSNSAISLEKTCPYCSGAPPRIFNPMLSFNPPRDEKRYLPDSWTRDTELSLHVYGALAPHGYRMGEVIRNKPPARPPEPGDPLLEIDTELGPQNLVFDGTRFAFDEPYSKTIKPLPLGYTTLEHDIFQFARPYFTHLDREELTVDRSLRHLFEPGYEDRWELRFFLRRGASFKSLGANPSWKPNRKQIRTIGFVMRAEQIKPGGPGLLALWAMDGTIGVLWSYLVANRHPEWLLEPGLRLVELVGPLLPERSTSLRHADDWQLTTILQHRLPGSASGPVPAGDLLHPGQRHQSA